MLLAFCLAIGECTIIDLVLSRLLLAAAIPRAPATATCSSTPAGRAPEAAIIRQTHVSDARARAPRAQAL
eukprot:4559877-Pleurochrysis_carterae.AAC.8